ncbi:unnamed protein product [Paramecium pentaurelia]|uniref:Uncharacterized protein n=1 Tax=Paramecium pentaurelia TaxID=43138 RepID=A0A8S1VZF3_9CILI|nr:unnamed protein product [Paramecium pentaurelia]
MQYYQIIETNLQYSIQYLQNKFAKRLINYKVQIVLINSEHYGFGCDGKVKKVDNEHYDKAIELKDEDDQEIGSGEEDEDQYQAEARGAQLSGFKKERFLCLLVLTIQMIIQIYKYEQKSNNFLSIFLSISIFNLRYNKCLHKKRILNFKYTKLLKWFWMLNQIHLYQIMYLLKVKLIHSQKCQDLMANLRHLVQLHQQSIYLNKSKKAKLDLLMREYVKVANRGINTTIHAIQNADKNPKEITTQISDVAEIHKKRNLHLFDILKLCLILKNQSKSGLQKSKTYSKALNYHVTILTWVFKNIVNSQICQIFLFNQLIIIEKSQSLCMLYSHFFGIQNKLKIQTKQ